MFKKYFKDFKGFTLIELMVVIAIIAILATIGLTAYGQAQKVTRDSKRLEDIQAAQKAIETFKITTGGYPTATGTLGNSTAANFNTYFQGSNVPTDPTNSGAYLYKFYSCSTDSTKYEVCAQLEACGTKCNFSSTPPDPCAPALNPGTGTLLYCVTN